MIRTPLAAKEERLRRGFLAPTVACALLVVMAALALVIDRLWLDAALVELRTSAEAAALAAAKELAADELLLPESNSGARLQRARLAAAFAAHQNTVAGRRVTIDAAPGGAVRFGRYVEQPETGQAQFLETETSPDSVLVTAARSRARHNSVALFLSGLTKQPHGELAASAVATLDNRVIALRPFTGTPIPAVPLAVLQNDPTGRREDTWQKQIEQRAGEDRFAFDQETGRVSVGSDGLPEIVLRSMKADGDAQDSNLQLIELSSWFDERTIVEQLDRGCRERDLHEHGGELRFDSNGTYLNSVALLTGEPVGVIQRLVGQPRIWLLYQQWEPLGAGGLGRCRCLKAVAGRMMAVNVLPDDQCEIVLQPCVITTRTAVLPGDVAVPPNDRLPADHNPYIYKLHLSN